jgi:ESS family glutamate:Na+ symporter
MPTLELTAAEVLGLAALGVVIGVQLKRRLPVLDRLNVPAPVLGGLLWALVVLGLRDRWLNFEMDLSLTPLLSSAFFTTVGMSASLSLLKKGGLQTAFFLLVATVGAIAQNAVGIALAKAFGLHALIGVVSGSVALTGGPATALAFGATFEKMGVEGATTIGVASAMFGILAGGLLGGFIGGRLIARHHLSSAAPAPSAPQPAEAAPAARAEAPEVEGVDGALLSSLVAVAMAMALGTWVSAGFQRAGVVLPAYVGAMMVAAVLRNVDDRWRFIGLSEQHLETAGNLALNVFIVMALLTLKLWELAHLAGPVVAMLAAQVALVAVMCLAVFRVMGRDYEAAVMSGGFCGFMLGTTANALACMGVLSTRYGPAPRAFLVVPIVGAFFIDLTNSLIVTTIANLLA